MGVTVNAWASIEGETPIDPSHLKDRSIKTRAELNVAEAENIRKAHVKYLAARPSRRSAPFDYGWFCRLHQEMFRDVWLWAGQTRKVDLNLGVHWTQIPAQLMDLVRDVAFWEKSAKLPRIEQAARLHYRAVTIHPFNNGNGRWARMLANIWLSLHKQEVTRWPESRISVTDSLIRGEYLGALRAADEGDHEPLVELHRRFS